jgi:glyoxylase-like metal-dependent hydrolase (beta-lactamase superfamily II)
MIKISSYGPVMRFDLARTLVGRGRYWTTAYLVDGLLVDSGCAHCATELLQELDQSPLVGLVNTHSHEDHLGANGALQHRQSDLAIWAHPLALPVLADPHRQQPLQPYRRFFWGWPEPSLGQPLADGEMITTSHHQFQVFYTPGHSLDHLCLYEAGQGWLFSGDLFVGGQDRALRAGCDIWKIIASLKKINQLPTDWLFPGSARVRADPAKVISAKIAYLEETGEQVLSLYQQGCRITEIVRRVCGGPIWIEAITLGHFSRRQLVLSFLHMNDDASTY